MENKDRSSPVTLNSVERRLRYLFFSRATYTDWKQFGIRNVSPWVSRNDEPNDFKSIARFKLIGKTGSDRRRKLRNPWNTVHETCNEIAHAWKQIAQG